jgi:type I restriction enzyme S subunit
MTWPTKKLVEVCEIVKSGITPFDEEKEYIDTNSVQNFSIVKSKPVTYKDRPSRANMEAKEDDVLVAKMANTLKVYLATLQDEKKRIFSTGFFVLRPKKELTEPKYLFLYCASNLFQNLKDELARGSTQKALNDEKLKKYFEIPLPPIEIQKRIVARIEELFEKIDKAKELRQKAQEETEQIFQSALQEIFDKAEKKWGMKKIREICEKIKQTHPKNIFKSEFNYIDITSIDPELKSIIGTKRIFVNKAPSRARKLVKEGDIIFATTRPYLKNIAYTSKNFDNCIASTGFCVIRPKKEFANSFYIFYAVNSEGFINQVLPLQRGASYPAVSDSDVYNCKIPLPPLPEQKKIVAYLDDLRGKAEKLKQFQQKQLEELNELKNSILDKALKGELTE